MPDPKAPDCLRCRAFYVTYDAARPHGCRTFGFQSRALPRDEVRLSTGAECAAFEPRAPLPGSSPPRSPSDSSPGSRPR